MFRGEDGMNSCFIKHQLITHFDLNMFILTLFFAMWSMVGGIFGAETYAVRSPLVERAPVTSRFRSPSPFSSPLLQNHGINRI